MSSYVIKKENNKFRQQFILKHKIIESNIQFYDIIYL